MRIKNVRSVLQYTPNMKKWKAENRKNHFVGIMLNGAAKHDFGYQEFVLSRNCVYFFNQRDDYAVEVYEPGISFSAHFTTYGEIETDSFCVPIKNPDDYVLLLEKLEHLSNASENHELLQLSILYKLCDHIWKARQKQYFSRDIRIQTAKNYMDEAFREPDSLRVAVAKSGLSQRRFNDLFKGNFGMTPNRYIVRRRIEHAKFLLELKNLTVSEVAELSGFSDVYYFSKVFKQICGVPPSKWK